MRRALLAVLVAALTWTASADAVTITELSAGITPMSGPQEIVAGPDGNLWFTAANHIGRISPSGEVTEFAAGISPNSGLTGIAAGPDGNVWFTENRIGRIGRITPTGTVTEFSAGISADSGPFKIAAGPDGNLWFTELGASRIARITPAGEVTEFSTGITANSGPRGIVAGPDGNLWFSEYDASRIGRITPRGGVTEFSAGSDPVSRPTEITAGPDGNLWFVQDAASRVARITPTGALTEFAAGITDNSHPKGITAGPEGNLWFTESDAGKLARVTPDGAVTEFSAGITSSSYPYGITAGPDGNLWFTAPGASRIGRILLEPPSVADEQASRVTPREATLTGTVNARDYATTYHFEYGPTTGYGSATSIQRAGDGHLDSNAPADLAGLAPETTYHYRLVATNRIGTTNGEDRTFVTAENPDRDGDGANRPLDCDDADPAIRPGALETPGNAIDENCDGVTAPFPKLDVGISPVTASYRTYTLIKDLAVKRAPVGTRAVVTCRAPHRPRAASRSCPFRRKTITATRARQTLSFTARFKRRKLPVRTVVTLTVTAPATIGRRVTITVKRRAAPRQTVCIEPGSKTIAC